MERVEIVNEIKDYLITAKSIIEKNICGKNGKTEPKDGKLTEIIVLSAYLTLQLKNLKEGKDLSDSDSKKLTKILERLEKIYSGIRN